MSDVKAKEKKLGNKLTSMKYSSSPIYVRKIDLMLVSNWCYSFDKLTQLISQIFVCFTTMDRIFGMTRQQQDSYCCIVIHPAANSKDKWEGRIPRQKWVVPSMVNVLTSISWTSTVGTLDLSRLSVRVLICFDGSQVDHRHHRKPPHISQKSSCPILG